MTALPPLTVEERANLTKLAEAATPGPWAYEAVNEKGNDWCVGVIVDANDQPVSGRVVGEQDGAVDEFVCFGDGLQNAAYIAAANPSVLLRLLSQVAALERDRDEWRSVVVPEGGAFDAETAKRLLQAISDGSDKQDAALSAALSQVREAEGRSN